MVWVLAKSALFKVPRLYTVTINRAWFKSPEEAYNYVMRKKFLARLLTKEMGVTRWLWVLEAQEKTGDGWPHWHILMDVSDLPGRWYHKADRKTRITRPKNREGWVYVPHFFDLIRAHRLLRKWQIGKECMLSVRREEFASSEHAIMYITKYLIKAPKRNGPPSWMLHHKRLRFIQASRALGCVVSDGGSVSKRKRPTGERKRKPAREPIDRIAECGSKLSFITYDKGQDRYIHHGPFYGQKEMVKTCPHAVTVQDFDFPRHNPFDVYGFTCVADVLCFEKAVTAPAIVAEVKEDIRQRREWLLSAWDSSNGVQPIQTG